MRCEQHGQAVTPLHTRQVAIVYKYPDLVQTLKAKAIFQATGEQDSPTLFK
jgi:hypothetical protein